jgi:hypothetical protein
MISKKDSDSMMKFVEGTRKDKMRDKKMGYKEGSPADMKSDRAQAKGMMVRGNKNQMPPKGWPK